MIGLSVNAEAGKRALASAARAAGPAIRAAVARLSLEARQKLVASTGSASPSDPFWGRRGAPGSFFGKRSGRTAQRFSPGGVVLQRGNEYVSAVGSPDRYVAKMEEGGTIKASGRLLRIPTAAAMTPAGVDRLAGTSIRSVPGMHLIRSRAGKVWAVLDRIPGKRSVGMTFMYLMTPSVRVHRYQTFARLAEMVRPSAQVAGTEAVQVIVSAAR